MVVASIDLMDGKAVQLRQGREKVLQNDDPIALAKQFDKYGEIAVIDLDAALGRGDNEEVIRKICSIAECRVGGGVRDLQKAKRLLSYGASKIILGTKAFENDTVNHSFLGEMKEALGHPRIIIAIDAIKQEIVTKGWQHSTGLDLFEVVPQLESYASEFLFTCVEKEGMMQGADLETIRKLRNATKRELTAAGGITTMEEIVALAQIGVDVQLGMALYTGKINLSEAFIECLNWSKGLIPTITCDPAGQVLMLAYSNKDSLKNTFATGNMCYFSRSRNKLWMKGETSNHLQNFIRVRTDCDQDTLLATVVQQGVACHLESYSCFGDRKFSLHELYDVVKDRIDNPRPNSYTASLSDDKLKGKILEEASELVQAEGHEQVIGEAADLLYLWTVLLAKRNLDINDVFTELRRRRRK